MPDTNPHQTLDTNVTVVDVDSPASTSMPSQLDLRDYELMETLGKGGMGEVYRCCDPALGRDLAIKVIQADYRDHPPVESRFLREARITSSLQHPNIVPVHNLGRLNDGRLHYTMRLVRGSTFADILKEEAGKSERLPYLLTIFEKICQAVAYAHSKRVIHRDLKPANVMVGRFGEVQVMDWGLAKVLTPEDAAAEAEERKDATGTRIPTDADTPVDLSRTGAGMGTWQYMPSEQARGKWDMVDERADVFALGSILCEILTGQPAYIGKKEKELVDRVERGDVAEALERLQQCGADAELRALCRDCLAPEREARPRDAAAVAKRVAEYQAEVQERLRRAELERVAAETRAREEQARALVEEERAREALARAAAEAERAREAQARARAERRAKRRTLALATMVLILVAGGLAALWWQQRQDSRRRQGVEAALSEVEQLQQQSRWAEARKVLEQAESRLGEGGPHDLWQRLEQARRDLDLVAQLDAIRLKRAMNVDGRTNFAIADRDYEVAFRTAGIAEFGDDTAVVGERIGKSAVRGALVAFLDDWAVCTRGTRRDWVLEVARKSDPDPVRDVLRDPKTWNDGETLARLAEAHETELSPQLLVAVGFRLDSLGRDAETLLKRGQERYPTDFWIYYGLGVVLSKKNPGERVGYYRAALALRPGTTAVHVDLGKVLHDLGRVDEAIAEYHKALQLDRNDAMAHSNLSSALRDKGHLDQAVAEAQKAIELDPKYPTAHNNLGAAFYDKGRLDEAIEECRIAIRLNPNYAKAQANLCLCLHKKGLLDEAITACQRAIKLDPKMALAHRTLGDALHNKGRLDEAIACYRKVLELDPKNPKDHNYLGNLLYEKSDLDGAIASLKQAVDLDPNYAVAHSNLSNVLRHKHDLPGATAHSLKAIALDPRFAPAYLNLGKVLFDKGDIDGAIARLRKAIDLDPKFALAYIDLGATLMQRKSDLNSAILCFRKAIELKPDYALPYYNLSAVLIQQGHFGDATATTKQGLKKMPSNDPMRKQLQQLLQVAQEYLRLEARLPAVLSSTEKLDNATEQIEFAELCAMKKLYPHAARLYAGAFAAEPKLADDLQQQHRYDAACSAVLAASREAEDSCLLPDKAIGMFRRWALRWLRDDLMAYTKLAGQNNPDAIKMIQQFLPHWRRDPDLASVRDPSALDRLPDSERAAWQALWRDVDELAKRVANSEDRPR